MTSVFTSTHRLMQMFDGKMQEFINDIDNIHMVWLEEIQQEANRMFSSDFSAEPELMPKTPSQKKSTRRRRVSSGRLEENRTKRRFSKGKRSNLRGSTVKTLNLIAEIVGIPEATTSEVFDEEPKRSTRRTKKTTAEVAVYAGEPSHGSCETDQSPVLDEEPETAEEDVAEIRVENDAKTENDRESDRSRQHPSDTFVPPQLTIPGVSVMISAADRTSAERAKKPDPSPGRSATKIAIAGAPKSSRRSSVRHSLTLRRSLAGLRHSMTQESIRRASRRSFLKKKARLGNSTCSSNVSEDACMDTDGEEVEENKEQISSEEAETEKPEASPEERMKLRIEPSVGRITRSKMQNTPTMAAPSSIISQEMVGTRDKGSDGSEKESACQSSLRSSQNGKRRAADASEGSPRKKPSPPKKSQTVIRPNMKSFLHTVQKNQLLMMTPSSLGRSSVMKSFIKHTTPLKIDPKLAAGLVEDVLCLESSAASAPQEAQLDYVTRWRSALPGDVIWLSFSGGAMWPSSQDTEDERERYKLEALRRKQDQEEERKKKMEEEKKRKQEEMKRKRDERLRRVVEARVKEELKEEEKKKKIEQKMAQIDEKNDKLRVERLAEEKAKKKVATKRQEELEQRRKLEEEARRKKIQQAVRLQFRVEDLSKEEEEVRQQKLLAKRRAEEEEQRARKLAEARRAQELKEQELERERQAAAERQRVEKEKALALQRELERAAREKERRELEEKRMALEEKRKREEQQRLEDEERAAKQREAAAAAATAAKNVLNADVQHTLMKTPASKAAGLNVTVDIERSPQSYELTPQGSKKPVVLNPNTEDYGMDQNSDDSTDDESAPRKPIPSWAEGLNLKQSIMKQYYHPLDLHSYFGEIEPPKLECIFYKSKPRYYKRTSSAVWNSPPQKAMW